MLFRSLSEDAEKITANLLAPLILCRRTHLARQIILQDPGLELRARVFADMAGVAVGERVVVKGSYDVQLASAAKGLPAEGHVH